MLCVDKEVGFLIGGLAGGEAVGVVLFLQLPDFQ